MYAGNYFWGMNVIWWIIWVIFLFIIFGMFTLVRKKKIQQDTPLDILQRRFAAGEIAHEEYQEKKKILEYDLLIKRILMVEFKKSKSYKYN